MAKSTLKSDKPKPTTQLATATDGTVHRLVITIPILAAVLFTIGYVQMGMKPLDDKSSTLTAAQTAQAAPLENLSALQIAPQTPAQLTPLAVTVTERPLSPTNSGIGDSNATASAQPTVTRLQAPPSPAGSDDGALQAHQYAGDLNELMNKL